MNDDSAPQAEAASGRGFNPVRYLDATGSNRLLIHGVLMQICGTITGFFSSAVHKDDGTGDLDAFQKLMTLSWGFSFLSSALGFIGWGLVIYACGKVVAESVKEQGS